ncbi:MAG: hypothetical protein HKP61_10735, partial [Dactylosporangium sp.]|nr:hypothetical protein [Dactylosporangium sp.]NNJ61405.1 hypothetical protein [Dactylosporangium sp.]
MGTTTRRGRRGMLAVLAAGVAAVSGCVPGPLDESSRRYGYLTARLDASLPGGGAPERSLLDRTRTVVADRLVDTGLLGVRVAVDSDRTLLATVLARPAADRDQQTRLLARLTAPGRFQVRRVLASTVDTPSESSPTGSSGPAATASPPAVAPPTTPPELDQVVTKLGAAYEFARRLPAPDPRRPLGAADRA